MPTSFEVIFLGNLSLIDTTQGNEVSENATGILGTYGDAANPLHANVQFLTAERLSEDENETYDTDNGGGFDSFRINGGAAQNFDGVAVYNAVITYIDGTTATISAVIFQDVSGNTYLAPEITNNADQAALTAAPIQSLTLQSVIGNTGDMTADRFAGDFVEPVDGTAGNDSIGPSYVDPQGDAVSNGNDYIVAGAGNDTINAVDGNDTILAGDGNDLIEDWNGNDSVLAGDGSDTVNLGAGNDTIVMEGGDDLVRVWDNTGANSLDGGSGSDTLDFANWQSSTGATVTVASDGTGTFSHFSGNTTGSFTGFETISGTAFDDRMVASSNTSGIGLSGEAGNDMLIGGAGQDQLDGGTGADTIYGNGGADSIGGGDGNDRIFGDNTTPGPVIVDNGDFSTDTTAGWTISGGGNTIVYFEALAFSANNTGFGGVAQQTINTQVGLSYQLSLDAFEFGNGSGNHTLVVEVIDANGQIIGNQTVVVNNGTSQNVTVDFTTLTPSVTIRFSNPTGTSTSDSDLKIDNITVTATPPLVEGDDTIDAGAGNDVVDAGGGDDSVSGGTGDDTIGGGAGDDSLTGGDGNDRIFGDNLTPAPVNVINGDFATNDNTGWTTTGSGTFVYDQFMAFNAANTAAGGTAQQTVATEIGVEYQLSFNAFETGTAIASHTLRVDVIDANGQVISTQTIVVTNGSSQLVTLDFTATTANTTLRFSNPNSTGVVNTDLAIDNVTVTALAGPTTTGNDTINAGEGSDLVDAGSGDDLVIVDGTFAGDDTLDGGEGNDTLALLPDDNRALTVDINAGFVTDLNPGSQVFSNFENLITGGGHDSVTGTAGANFISTQGGNDTVQAGAGNDTVEGGGGEDSILGEGGDDLLLGDAGNDTLSGGSGDDTLLGGNGDDLLIAGNNTGAGDSLSGGAGDDYLIDSFWNATLDGGTGSDLFELGYGNATVIGGEDIGNTDVDLMDFQTANDAVNILYTGDESGTYTDSDGDDGEFSQIEGIILTDQADTVNATADTSGTTILGLGGNDQLTGGQGDDYIDGGTDNDSIAGGAGNDTLLGGSGEDTLFGGDGDDTINGAGGNDTIDAGAGTDTVDGGFGNDLLSGGDGNDTILGGSGNDTIDGGAGDDLLVTGSYGGVYATSNDAGGNTNVVSGGDGNDTILASVGADTLSGDAGDDSIDGQGGDDVITGGDGNDTLIGGAGADTLTGGAGPDVFVVDDGGDIITDFDTTTGIQGGGTPDQTDNDFVDLSAFYNETTLAAWNAANPTNTFVRPIDWLRADHADDGALAEVGGLQIRGADGQPVAANELNFENTNVVCFANGTRIATAQGAVKVEDLKPGDLVMTMDHGLQPLRWIGSRRLDRADFRRNEKLRPIRLSAAALGMPVSCDDLLVSPQHRIMLASPIAQRMFGCSEVLIAAKDLLEIDGITIATDVATLSYYHLLFDDHEIVFANGMPAESLYLGTEARKALTREGLAEIHAIFPQIAVPQFTPVACRPMLSGKRARKLGWRHANNRKPLIDPRMAQTGARDAMRVFLP